MTDILARQRQLIGTTQEWADNDLVIGDGEIAIEREPLGSVLFKIGDGATAYSFLPYYGGGGPNTPDPHFATEEEMFSDTDMGYGPGAGTFVEAGDPVFTGGGTFVVADEAAPGYDEETAGGVKLLRLSGFGTGADLIGNYGLNYSNAGAGNRVEGGAFPYEVAQSEAPDADIETPGGAKLYAQPSGSNVVYAEQFGAVEGFDPSNPAANDAKAAGNTTAIQAALDACRDRGYGEVYLRGRGYAVNTLTVHEGVALKGGPMNNAAFSNVKTPSTVLWQPQGYTASSLVNMYADNYNNNRWGATVERLLLRRSGTSGEPLLTVRGGARALVRDVDLIGGSWGMKVDGTQDSRFYSVRRSDGVHGIDVSNTEAAGQSDTCYFYDAWIESCTGLALNLVGDSTVNLGNAISFINLKLEGSPTLADEFIYIKDVIGVELDIASLQPGGGATQPGLGTDTFALIRMAGRFSSIMARAMVAGNNNKNMHALVSMESTNSESGGVNFLLGGKITGAVDVDCLVDYGDTGEGHSLPRSSVIDVSAFEISGSTLTAAAESAGMTPTVGHRIVRSEAVYGVQEHRPHPLGVNSVVDRWAGSDGTKYVEMRNSATSFSLNVNGGANCLLLQPSGKMQIREPEFLYPEKRSSRTIAQLVAGDPNPTSFPGGMIMVSDATPANRPAWSDGTAWRYVSDNTALA